MKILLNIIFDSFSALGNLVLLVVIVIFIFAVLGMQVVGKQYIPRNFGAMTIEDENFPRLKSTYKIYFRFLSILVN